MYVGDLTDIVDTHWSVEMPSHTTAGCSENSPNSWPVPPRNTVPRSKSSRKCGRVKSTRSVAVQTERNSITRLRVRVRVFPVSETFLRRHIERAIRPMHGTGRAVRVGRSRLVEVTTPYRHNGQCTDLSAVHDNAPASRRPAETPAEKVVHDGENVIM
jgi:predicted RNase H-like nuclease